MSCEHYCAIRPFLPNTLASRSKCRRPCRLLPAFRTCSRHAPIDTAFVERSEPNWELRHECGRRGWQMYEHSQSLAI
eukprot:scaffold630_cov174-Amphora_coffeaeformis.AAC.7